MVHHKCFDAIGFKSADFEEFKLFLDMACEKGFHPQSPRGLYVYWPVGAGIEFWIAFDKQQKPLGGHPHFLGSSRVEVKLLALFDAVSELSGVLHVEANPRAQGSEKHPLVFSVPSWDYTNFIVKEKVLPGATGPAIFSVQLTAFVKELHCFDTEEAYYARTTDQFKLSADHFVPTGLFVEEGIAPNPDAAFAGRILQAHVLTNSATSQRTLYLSVQTLGMVVDVVADPKVVTGRPKLGGIVSGYFQLSGRMTAEIEMTNTYFKLA